MSSTSGFSILFVIVDFRLTAVDKTGPPGTFGEVAGIRSNLPIGRFDFFCLFYASAITLKSTSQALEVAASETLVQIDLA